MNWHNRNRQSWMGGWQDEEDDDQHTENQSGINDRSCWNNSPMGDDWHSRRVWHHTTPDWFESRPKKRRFLFVRFLFFFVPMVFVFVMVIMLLLKMMYRPLQDMIPHSGMLMGLIFGLPIVIGLIAFFFGGMAFRRFGSPLADIMAALDAVAGGDLSVRIDESARGEFGKMGRSFNRMAEELDHAETNRRNMTADVAHELRTPLHIIQGNLEGMLDGVYEPTKDQINATLDETRLLARLVNDLQTLSLAEAGKLHLHCETISAADLVSDTVTSFTALAAENGLQLESEISGTEKELTITADPDRLSQVLNNLVANAMRYTPSGGMIKLKVTSITNGVQMVVEDTGSGISEEDLPYVFDRFWKAEKSRARHEGTGSGLGLAIARQLVQAHGGTIRVESQTGKGTRFILEIPSVGKGC